MKEEGWGKIRNEKLGIRKAPRPKRTRRRPSSPATSRMISGSMPTTRSPSRNSYGGNVASVTITSRSSRSPSPHAAQKSALSDSRKIFRKRMSLIQRRAPRRDKLKFGILGKIFSTTHGNARGAAAQKKSARKCLSEHFFFCQNRG